MPELAEVETIVRALREPISGRRVMRARLRAHDLYRRGSLRVGWLVGRTIVRVERAGKNAVFRFDPEGTMSVNLGMTGQLILASPNGHPPAAPKKHLHGRFRFDDGTELQYFDARRFGHLYVTRACDIAGELGIGPDPFEIDAWRLRRSLARRRAAVKTLLLDQRLVSGLGNIYTDETLFAARIDPRTPGGLAARESRRLLSSARRVLERAIEHGGSTVRDYRRPDGSRGGFQQFHAVYGREGAPCVRCGTPIEKIVLGGRGTHFCPSCQR